jgi:hypothetical protein
LGEVQREVAYVGRVVSTYDKREAKQRIRVVPNQPVNYRAPKAPPPPPANNQETVVRDQTIWGQI